MRSVIFLGLATVGKCINAEIIFENAMFLFVITVIAFVCDVAETYRKWNT
jgi:hypothetical protein